MNLRSIHAYMFNRFEEDRLYKLRVKLKTKSEYF